MIFFKAMIILSANVLLGYLFIKILYLILFFPKKGKYIFGKRIFFTPGYVYKKKDFLEKKVNYLFEEYVNNKNNKKKFVIKIQKKCSNYLEKKLNIKNKNKIIAFFLEKLKILYIVIVQKLVFVFFNTFIPFIIEKYSLERYVEILNLKIEIFLMKNYLEKYFFRYLIYFFSILGFILGLLNAGFYLIIN